MIRNNKAISAVIATVLIILITVAAITIIWAAIIPLINKQLSSGTNCLDAVAQVQIVSDEGYTCYKLPSVTDGTCSATASGCDVSKSVCEATTGTTPCAGTWTGNSNMTLQVKHGAKDFVLADISVLVSAGGDSTTLSVKNATQNIGTEKGLPGPNEAVVYILNTTGITGTISKVEIAPVVEVGNTQDTCDISSSAVISECD